MPISPSSPVSPAEIVESEALKLSPEERADLADRLWMSVHGADQLDEAWEVEIADRLREIDAGAVPCRNWSDVMGDLRVKHG